MLVGSVRGRALGFVSALVAVATVVTTTPVAAAAVQDPSATLVAEVIVSGGPISFIRAFEGLGDVALLRRGDFREGVGMPRGQVRLIRAFTRDRSWWDWRQEVLDGHARQARHDVSIVLLDETFTEVARWELKDAWPESLKVSLGTDRLAQEELTLAHGAISLVNPPPGP